MTFSDPLLKELKGYIAIILQSDQESINENSDLSFSLCHCLESIFTKGLVRYDGFSPWKTDPFQWFYQLVRKYHKIMPLEFKIIFEQILDNQRTKTPVGKTRLLLRTCLKKRCLHIPIQFHIEHKDYLNGSLHVNYNPKNSILGHEILVQIFFSLVKQLNFFSFPFDLSNCSFLDESWHLPVVVNTEMVPCEKLGLTLGFPMGFAVIVKIIENSCADELRNMIAVGDILDSMNGIAMRNLYGPKIDEIFRKIRSRPFTLSFIKGRIPRTAQIYLPVIKLYRILGLDPLILDTSDEQNEEEYLQPPFVSKKEENQKEIERRKCPFLPNCSGSNVGPQGPEQNIVDDLLSSTPPPPSPPLAPRTNPEKSAQSSCSSCSSHLKPYPTSSSQKNDSSASALNLQMYNADGEQLIV